MKTDENHITHPEELEDEEIIHRIRNGCKWGMEHLIEKYKPVVRAKSRSYFLVGADREDIVQEGMIGLFKAIRDYREDKSIPFRMFAEMCITRQIITAIKTATRQKHIPLNSYVSLNKRLFDEESDKMLIEMLQEVSVTDPEELFISKEDYSVIESKLLELLSPFEKQVLSMYLSGIAYQEIARQLNKPVKSIDNALQRLKKKIEKSLLNNRHEAGA
ncbi:MAG TPA: RNA polymerase sporulation sigma factor SigH [Thermoclostridium caenicola]|nr:RNA polymerase sporulation sigma factor SigH [Thermoclostridium caenicola]HOK43215.1 RNA polymerase sporulation sigma factor SigH [Thermoclostridium caenicola]HOL84030.1 RNA polymerase sporulation sigma factor SigH [Thermoclostridium caenicola]HOP71962.1 RNA polymerase sporulation sigma factor SigH [Thermoclostridium caenicola]HPO77087.1 RNA polymerase sporulation sigma factor SigH [Thermoclostridium caenicola]